MRAIPALFATLLIASAAAADSAEWDVDASHSNVGFSVSHMVVSKVKGRFKEVTGKAIVDEADPSKSVVNVTIPVSSINTDDEKRDAHLKGADFFDAANFPNIVFHSTKITRAGGEKFKVAGDLTIHGVTKNVTLDGKLTKPIKTPWGNQVRGGEISGKIDRRDYGLVYNKTLEAGGVVIGNEVTLEIAVELKK
jgi:polyisoprenoid-binding protein YceI